jgi:DDE superfamily endonuclease
LPNEYTTILTSFARLFSQRIWKHVQILLIGAMLTPGQRTVAAVLRIMGLDAEKHFQNYHRALNRAVWSNLAASGLLLAWLIKTFVPRGPIFLGLDDTIERRRGAKIKAKGIYRDPVRSSHSHFVKASGLRWLSLMLLAPIPWAKRVWALPFLTALCPSERYSENRGRRHKKLTDWARQLLYQAHRWLPGRQVVVLADASFAAIELLGHIIQLPNPICMITRFRLDAALYCPAPPRKEGQKGRPRKKGARLPTLKQVLANPKTAWKKMTVPDWYGEGRREVEMVSDVAVWFHNGMPALPIRWVLIRDPKGAFDPQALLCTDLVTKPEQMVKWFVMRWRVEVTFHEVRTHLGVETQRQWSDLAISRTTPVLLGLFSLVTLLAHTHARHGKLPVRQAAWYSKPLPTFSDALAIVRQNLWQHVYFQPSHLQGNVRKISAKALECLRNAVCYTA